MRSKGRLQSPIPDLHFSIPRLESSIPRLESSIPRLESSIPRVESSFPRLESSIPYVESSFPRLESSIPGVKSKIPGGELTFTPSLRIESWFIQGLGGAWAESGGPKRTLQGQQIEDWTDHATSTDTKINLSGLDRGVEYDFRVLASNAIGDSTASNVVSVVL